MCLLWALPTPRTNPAVGYVSRRKANSTEEQSPTLGAHTHAHPYPWVLGGHGWDVIVHGWAWVGMCFVQLCIQLQIGVKLFRCREYTNQEALRAEAKTVDDLLFV